MRCSFDILKTVYKTSSEISDHNLLYKYESLMGLTGYSLMRDDYELEAYE